MNTSNKARYMQLLLRDFHALEFLIEEKKLESGIRRFGYELELNFVNREFEPALIGTQVRDRLANMAFTTEFSRFNLEVNSVPATLEADCLARLSDSLDDALVKVRREAGKEDCEVLLAGIIPTLDYSHITPDALTPEPRYQALYALRKELKGEQYEYHIQGMDTLLTRNNMALFAGCVTSFQMHLQIDADDLVDRYNWAQLIAGPLVACAAYSPLFLGKRLWHETRVALFEQATDTRNPQADLSRNQARVYFGEQWLRDSALELLQEDIANFNAMFTLDEVEDPWAAMENGAAPALEAWSMFNGSIYRWNRLCYGRIGGSPSLRIENRILPSGPTVVDMVANSAFWVGTMMGLPAEYRNIQNKVPFEEIKQNFFQAARLGLEVNFRWVNGRVISARQLILEVLLPVARQGLQQAGIAQADADFYLDIIRARTESGKTGTAWMLKSYDNLLKVAKRDEALHILTAGIIKRQLRGTPVHTWAPVAADEAGDSYCRLNCVQKIMSTSLYKVGVDDVLDLAAHIMEWKRIGHIPVEDHQGKLVGVITRNTIINFMVNAKDRSSPTSVGELMIRNPLTVSPETPLAAAAQLLLDHKVSCLLVVRENRTMGIVTERDFVVVARDLMNAQEKEA